MRNILVSALLAMVGISFAHASDDRTQIRILETSTSIAKIFKEYYPDLILAQSSPVPGVAVLLIAKERVPLLSALAHEAGGICGGFIDVTSETLMTGVRYGEHRVVAPVAVTNLPALGQPQASVVQALNLVEPKNLELFATQYSQQFKTRDAGTAEGQRAPLWLQSTWLKMAQEAGRTDVQVDLMTAPTGYAQQSVRITIPGSDPTLPIVVLGGHLDSINSKDWFGAKDAPGVDDNASGISALTEAYRVMLAANIKPKHTIQIFGYSAEEMGLLGSRVIAEQYQKAQQAVRGVLQLDMVAFPGNAKAVTFVDDYVNSDLSVWTEQLLGLYVGVAVAHTRCGYPCSDHASWHRYGYPAVMPFEAPFNQMNRKIHSAQDLWDVQMNSDHAAQFSKLAYAYAAILSEAP